MDTWTASQTEPFKILGVPKLTVLINTDHGVWVWAGYIEWGRVNSKPLTPYLWKLPSKYGGYQKSNLIPGV